MMRNFQTLDKVTVDDDTGIIYLTVEHDTDNNPLLAMRLEGSYLAISASYGPIEIALRPRLDEVTRVLERLRPVEGLQITRHVGTGNANLGVGLKSDGMLLLRPTIVGDATGHLGFNLALTANVRQALFAWLSVEAKS
jgi:hypothetical protein